MSALATKVGLGGDRVGFSTFFLSDLPSGHRILMGNIWAKGALTTSSLYTAGGGAGN